MEANKGDIIEIKLDNLAHGGDCVGHYHGLAVFVPEGVPGERVRVKIIDKKKNYARGEIKKVIEPVDIRVTPHCPVFTDCGGCQLQHLDYDGQLKHKKEMVSDVIRKIGGLELDINPIIGSDYPFAYRNKAQFPLTKNDDGEIVTGFYQKGTHKVVKHHSCSIQHPLLNRIMNKTLSILNKYQLSVYNEKTHQGLLRHLVIRAGICTNQALLILVTSKYQFPQKKEIATSIIAEVPELIGVLQNINPEKTNVILGKNTYLLQGQDYYFDYIGETKYAISPLSFFQVNTLQTKKLYDIIVEFANLKGQETVIDAYCGIGSISLYLSSKMGRGGKMIGIEEAEDAVIDARKNAELNNINNCEFITGKVEKKLKEFLNYNICPDLVIFDPPRKGIEKSVIKTILKVLPDDIIYVSCNPATLARDLAQIKKKYIIKEIQPVDMFPHTYHIENVALMKKKK